MKKLLSLLLVAGVVSLNVACNSEASSDAAGNDTATKVEKAVDLKKSANAAGDAIKDAAKGDTAADPDVPKTKMEFADMTHDFGTIDEGDKVSHVFKFKNTGDEPLIINSAKGSCGCTVPEWPKEPIAPGGQGDIKVEFNSKGKKNKQTKTVTINANTDPNPTRLTIKADVTPADGEAASAKK